MPIVENMPTRSIELERIARETRVFISMPYVKGVTPRVLAEQGVREKGDAERIYGTFRIDEVGLPAFDHGVLYGDAVFEGILLVAGHFFQWREHLQRLYASANLVQIDVPYSPEELTERVLQAVSESPGVEKGHAYLRLVITRGLGDLGLHPNRCVGSTIYCIVSQIQLYPASLYERGISLSLARKTRRVSADILDPQIKSCNYLNNVMALLETVGERASETLMLTPSGFISEATADNIFLVSRKPGWEESSANIALTTPITDYCLKGITRDLVLGYGAEFGFQISESGALIPEYLNGTEIEVFLTGTAAGIVPVISFDGRQIGSGIPGPVTHKLRDRLAQDMDDPRKGLSTSASKKEIQHYLLKRDSAM
jgi:branched-chain amino acid aminotransferase